MTLGSQEESFTAAWEAVWEEPHIQAVEALLELVASIREALHIGPLSHRTFEAILGRAASATKARRSKARS